MQNPTAADQLTELHNMFTQKYDEPIAPEKLTHLIAKHGYEVVKNVIGKMKPDAYEPTSYLSKCLDSGWYKSEGKQQPAESKANVASGMSSEAASTLRFTWNYKMERGWIDKAERDFMLDVLLNGTEPDEEKVQDINFRCLQGMYPNAPATWFYWLPQYQRRAAANTWIVQSGREDLKLYETA